VGNLVNASNRALDRVGIHLLSADPEGCVAELLLEQDEVRGELYAVVGAVLAACLSFHDPHPHGAAVPQHHEEVHPPTDVEATNPRADLDLPSIGRSARCQRLKCKLELVPSGRACVPRAVLDLGKIPKTAGTQGQLPAILSLAPDLLQHRVECVEQPLRKWDAPGEPAVVEPELETALTGLEPDEFADLTDADSNRLSGHGHLLFRTRGRTARGSAARAAADPSLPGCD
jgi:hypothetical protein